MKTSLLKSILKELTYRGIVKNQTDLGNKLGYNKSYVSELMNGREKITDKVIDTFRREFGISKQYFASNGEDPMFEEGEDQGKKERARDEVTPLGEESGRSEAGNNGLEFIPLSNGQLLMGVPHVNEYVYGGYLTGFKDQEFIEEMPKHYIPVNQRHRGRYLSFTMRGESMRDGTEKSISPGDIITGREIQKKYWSSRFHTKDYPEFIIHTAAEGLVVKQITEHNTTEGWITLHSYNPEYADYKVMLDDCVEIFNVIEVSKKNRHQY